MVRPDVVEPRAAERVPRGRVGPKPARNRGRILLKSDKNREMQWKLLTFISTALCVPRRRTQTWIRER